MKGYGVYVDRLTELKNAEDKTLQAISKLKNKKGFFVKVKNKKKLEDAYDELDRIRAEAARICDMLDKDKDNEEGRTMDRYIDTKTIEYNEIIGVCYNKIIVVTCSGELLYNTLCPEKDDLDKALLDKEITDNAFKDKELTDKEKQDKELRDKELLDKEIKVKINTENAAETADELIGYPTDCDNYHLLAELDKATRRMILTYLTESPKTPVRYTDLIKRSLSEL